MFVFVDFKMDIILHSAVAHRPALRRLKKGASLVLVRYLVTRAKHALPCTQEIFNQDTRTKFSTKTPRPAVAIILSDLHHRHPNTGPPTPPAVEGRLPPPHSGGTSLTPPFQSYPLIWLVRLTGRDITPAIIWSSSGRSKPHRFVFYIFVCFTCMWVSPYTTI